MARLVDPFVPLRAGSRIFLRAEPPRRARVGRSRLVDWTIFMLGAGAGGIVTRLLLGGFG